MKKFKVILDFLGAQDGVTVTQFKAGEIVDIKLDVATFAMIAQTLISKTMQPVKKALRDAGLRCIDGGLLCGQHRAGHRQAALGGVHHFPQSRRGRSSRRNSTPCFAASSCANAIAPR